MVRRPQVAVGDATADADELDVGAGHRDVDADLVVRARRDERRDRVGEGHLAGVGQPGGDADQCLLGDADVEVAPGRDALELVEQADAEVPGQRPHALVVGGELGQRVEEGVPHEPHPPSSARTRSRSAGLIGR